MVAQLDTSTSTQHDAERVGCPDMSPQEILAEAQKLSLADQDAIANQLTSERCRIWAIMCFQEA